MILSRRIATTKFTLLLCKCVKILGNYVHANPYRLRLIESQKQAFILGKQQRQMPQKCIQRQSVARQSLIESKAVP